MTENARHSQSTDPSRDFLVRAPGRVNLIGDHTDYNAGFVLPMAIDHDLRLAARRRDDESIVLRSDADDSMSVLEIDSLGDRPPEGWAVYVWAVARALVDAGYRLAGIDGSITGELPIAAGLSSSAALELLAARALLHAAGADWDARGVAGVCQRAESDYVGNRCGPMDQLAVAMGRTGQALLIDCRSLEISYVPLPPEVAVVVADSGRRRQLAGSAYNQRRAECEAAARRLGVPALRDATAAFVEVAVLPEPLGRRALHVVRENERVTAAAAALRAGERRELGRLMSASHASLRDLFEVSSPELNELVAIAEGIPGCLGARLTGAGFGGCTVNLVEVTAAQDFCLALEQGYQRKMAQTCRTYLCHAAEGVSLA